MKKKTNKDVKAEQLEGEYLVLLAGRAEAGKGSKNLFARTDVFNGGDSRTYFRVEYRDSNNPENNEEGNFSELKTALQFFNEVGVLY